MSGLAQAFTSTTMSFTITFHGPFHVATGLAADGLDRTVDPHSLLPASSLKGVMRSTCEQRLRLNKTIVAEVFGQLTAIDLTTGNQAPSRPGAWAWSDAVVNDYTIGPSVRIEMSDHGVVEDHALLFGEDAWAKAASFTIALRSALTIEQLRDQRLVLRGAARALSALGGNRRRGSGWVSINDDEPWTDDDSAALIALTRPAPVSVMSEQAPAAHTFHPAGPVDLVVFEYRLVAEQRISAGVGAEIANSQLVHSVLPGTVIRGGLANAWMLDHQRESADQLMADLFDTDILFGQAVPVGTKLVSASAMSPKYRRDPATVPFDRAFEAMSNREHPVGTTRSLANTDAGRGWSEPKQADKTSALVSATRTALGADGAARNGQLFTTAAIASDTVFVGRVSVPRSNPLFIQWLRDVTTIRVGGQRSISGQASFELLHEVVPDGGIVADTAVLRCRSPLIVLDEFGAPTLDPTSAMRRAFGDSVTVVDRWIRSTRVSGWHAASGFPKGEDWAIASGSTFLVSGLPENAKELLRVGLGIRRQEGFGDLEVLRSEQQSFGDTIVDPGSSRASGVAVDESAALTSTRREAASQDPGSVPITAVIGPTLSVDRARPAPAPQATPVGPIDVKPSPPVVEVPTQIDLPHAQRPAAVPRLDPFGVLFESFTDQRGNVSFDLDPILKGIADTARSIASYKAAGMDTVANAQISRVAGLPWLRAQAETVVTAVTDLLRSSSVAAVADRALRELDLVRRNR